MLKKIIPQILSSLIVSIVASIIIVKFQRRIESMTDTDASIVSLVLLTVGGVILAIPIIISRLTRSPKARANLIGWGLLFYIHLSVILFAILSVTAVLFLASTKLPTRENLPYYLVNVGPLLGLIGVISHILLNAGQYIASETRVKFFDISLISDILNFLLIAWLIYAFPDKPINPVVTILSIGMGTGSFGFALGTFSGHFRGTEMFIRDIALEMREKESQLRAKDEKLKLFNRVRRSQRKRRK